MTSTIVQNKLKSGLPEALKGIPDKWKVNIYIRDNTRGSDWMLTRTFFSLPFLGNFRYQTLRVCHLYAP
jgi:hypothetical protein